MPPGLHVLRFSLRGLENVQAEWQLVCLTHNLLKLYRSGQSSPDAGAGMNQGVGCSETRFYRPHTGGLLRSLWIAWDSFRALFIPDAALHPSETLSPTGS